MYDCVIIGGGPAGLTCAIYLARFKWKVLVIHNGHHRNYASVGVHGMLGYDGVKPMVLIRAARKEALKFGGNFHFGTADKIKLNEKSFNVNCENDIFTSKSVVLAYGIRDVLPDIKGIEKYYGTSVYHCPICDGYEIINKKTGVIGDPFHLINLAVQLKQWTNDIIILGNGIKTSNSLYLKRKLKKNKIGIIEKSINSLNGDGKTLKYLTMADGEKINFDALFFSSSVNMSCNLHNDIKCGIDHHNKIRVSKDMETSIKGIFAIGDIVPGPQLVTTACAGGAIAAIAIDKKLLKIL